MKKFQIKKSKNACNSYYISNIYEFLKFYRNTSNFASNFSASLFHIFNTFAGALTIRNVQSETNVTIAKTKTVLCGWYSADGTVRMVQ